MKLNIKPEFSNETCYTKKNKSIPPKRYSGKQFVVFIKIMRECEKNATLKRSYSVQLTIVVICTIINISSFLYCYFQTCISQKYEIEPVFKKAFLSYYILVILEGINAIAVEYISSKNIVFCSFGQFVYYLAPIVCYSALINI